MYKQRAQMSHGDSGGVLWAVQTVTHIENILYNSAVFLERIKSSNVVKYNTTGDSGYGLMVVGLLHKQDK